MITISAEQLERAQKEVGHIPDGVKTVLASAMNRAVAKGNTEAKRAAAKGYVVTQREVGDTLMVIKAKKSTLVAKLTSKGRSVRLYHYRVVPRTLTSPRPTNGLRVMAKTNTGWKTLAHAFIAKFKAGEDDHLGVFVREKGTVTRYLRQRTRKDGTVKSSFVRGPKLRQLYGVYIPSMLGTEAISTRIENEMQRVFDERFDHEISRLVAAHPTSSSFRQYLEYVQAGGEVRR